MLRIIKLPKFFGMPPDTHVSENLKLNSMPVLKITPHVPEFQAGLSLFRLKKAWDTTKSIGYKDLLEIYGFELDSTPVRIAFIADSFPTDTFANEYADSFLNRVTDIASSGAAEIAQITGTRSAGEGVDKIANALKEAGGMAGALGSGITGAKNVVESAGQALGNTFTSLKGSGGLISKLMAGARVDFPQIWKNSGFQPSYSVTCRLYNPNPKSDEATEKYIIGPIAAILCLCLPQTEDGNTYSWPFIHKIDCPGLFSLNAAFISNVTVIKGGDQQQIAWNKRLGIVDVRIDFGGLYSSMLIGDKNPNEDRSTLMSYLSNLRQSSGTEDIYKDPENTESSKSNSTPAKTGAPTRKKLVEDEININKNKNASGYIIKGPGYKETVSSVGNVKTQQKQYSYTSGGVENTTDNENFYVSTGRRVSTTDSYVADFLGDTMPNF